METFAGVAVPGRQWNFRCSRQLRPDPLTTAVGPLSIHVIEGLRRYRLVRAPDDSGNRFEINSKPTSVYLGLTKLNPTPANWARGSR